MLLHCESCALAARGLVSADTGGGGSGGGSGSAAYQLFRKRVAAAVPAAAVIDDAPRVGSTRRVEPTPLGYAAGGGLGGGLGLAPGHMGMGIPRVSCAEVAVRSAVRGAAVGATFGAVFAVLNGPAAGGGHAPAVAAHAGQAAMRNAGAFAAWTGVYGFTRCHLVKARRTNDVLNPAIAGGFTGAVLSLATIPRAYWRFSTQQVLHNAGVSAVIAVAFDLVNRL